MISRIVPLLAFSLLASTAAPKNPADLISTVGETKVLTVDLSSDPGKPRLDQAEAALKTEIQKGNLKPARRAEVQTAMGLIFYYRQLFDEAADEFRKTDSASPLYEAAAYYRALSLLRKGEERSRQNSDFGDALDPCREARETFAELTQSPPGPFRDSAVSQLGRSTLCLAKALAAKKRLKEASPIVAALLASDERIGEADREFLVAAQVAFLRQETRTLEADMLLERELAVRPLAMELLKLKTPKSAPPSPAETSGKSIKIPIPPFRPREKPDEALFAQAKRAQSNGKADEATRLLTQLFVDYPGSTAAQKAEGVVRLLIDSLARRKKFPASFVEAMKKIPPDPMYEVGKILWQKDLEDEALDLLQNLLAVSPDSMKAGNAHYIIGRIHENRREWEKARDHFKIVATRYSASPFFDQAHFKTGWNSYLMGDDKTAQEWMEYDRSFTRSSYTQAKADYWLAKVLERQKKTKESEGFRDEVRRVGPLSYYAFLAGKIPEFLESATGTALPQTYGNTYLLVRARAYLACGLHGAAMKTLKNVDLATEPALSEQVALLYDSVHQYTTSFRLAYSMAEKVTFNSLPAVISRLLFPIDFEEVVRQEAEAQKLDPILVFSVIKQESAYNEAAESRSGALGLMQLMPETAVDLARKSNEPVPTPGDLLKSETNVRLGIRYLRKMIERYNGNAYYAFAAYNAGPDRVDVWVRQWGNQSIQEFVELIPFEETRNYVKSIARNYAFYNLLREKRQVDLQALTKVAFQ